MEKYLRQTGSCLTKKDKDPQIGFKTGSVLATFSNTRAAFCLQHRCNNLASGYFSKATFAKTHGYCSILHHTEMTTVKEDGHTFVVTVPIVLPCNGQGFFPIMTRSVQRFFQTKPNNIPKHGSWINMISA